MKDGRPDRLLFGTAGTPHSSSRPDSASGIAQVARLGLDCMELEFVRGVRMGPEGQRDTAEAAARHGVALSAHGPYYINLNSPEKAKVESSVKRILDTARVASSCSARTITFHAASYMGMEPKKVHGVVRGLMKRIVGTLRDEGVDVWVRPEVTGKASQYGSLEELVLLSSEVEGVLPCVDFSHLHSRSAGGYNTEDQLRAALASLEDNLGRLWLDDAHIHLQGVEYTAKGEHRHLDLADSDLNYRAVLRVLGEFDVKGVLICESPNLEGDALLLKRAYCRIL